MATIDPATFAANIADEAFVDARSIVGCRGDAGRARR